MKTALVSLAAALLPLFWAPVVHADPVPPAPVVTTHEAGDLLIQPHNQYFVKVGDAFELGLGKKYGNGISFEATGLPPGLSINAQNGDIKGTLTDAATPGDYQVNVLASDRSNPSSPHYEWQSFWITVLDLSSPQVVSPGTQLNTAGDTVALQIKVNDTHPVKFKAYGLPPGLAIDENTGLISGRLADNDTRWTYGVSIMVANDHAYGGTVFTWVVLPNK